MLPRENPPYVAARISDMPVSRFKYIPFVFLIEQVTDTMSEVPKKKSEGGAGKTPKPKKESRTTLDAETKQKILGQLGLAKTAIEMAVHTVHKITTGKSTPSSLQDRALLVEMVLPTILSDLDRYSQTIKKHL